MPPSTVFSYWRRDHRRSTASPASLPVSSTTSKGAAGNPVNTSPQLSEIPHTPTLSTTLEDEPSRDVPLLEGETNKLKVITSAAPLSSASLAAPSPSIEEEKRPKSSPYERGTDTTFTQPYNTSQLPPGDLRSDQDEANWSSKSHSRRSFGKGLRNLQTPTVDTQKHLSTAGPGPGNFRLKTSPDISPTDKPVMSQREVKGDGPMARRVGEPEVSGEHAHHKSGKAMLHMLNPISLLSRRRSSHMGSSRADDSKLGAPNLIPAIPDDYDPRIRGNIVHDFSAPRPRRTVSSRPAAPSQENSHHDTQNPSSAQCTEQNSSAPWADQTSRHSDYLPVFKEHFEDDQNVRQLENKGYLQSSLLTNSTQPGYEKSIPVFARKLPLNFPEQSCGTAEQNVPASADLPADSTQAISDDRPASQLDPDVIPKPPQQPTTLPKHLKSNASRFSFDMGGVESSTQEKLLEEKHKAKEAARKLENGYFDDFDDEFDLDTLDYDDDLEEKIPGVNTDADDDDYLAPSLGNTSWVVPALSPVMASQIMPAPPEVLNTSADSEQGRSVNADFDQLSPRLDTAIQSQVPNDKQLQEVQQPSAADGGSLKATQQTQAHQELNELDNDEDDLYFDDGEFGDLTVNNQDEGFDESIFDDETSHLYERRKVGELSEPHAAPNPDFDAEALQRELAQEEAASHGLKHMPSVAGDDRSGSMKRGPLGEPIPNMGPTRPHGGVLTEQNLEVLHNALAFAANEAAGKGRIDRTFSTTNLSGQESVSQNSHTGDSQPGMIPDDDRLSQGADAMGIEDTLADPVFDDDDAYYDDAIVAAANAEALENDDEGFYGQEFGFYAQAHGTCSSELTNGGYFGPRGVEGITRSHSSRGKFEEPSLTPITERSEWSTRNSVISLKTHGATHSNPSLASPGLAQLVDMGNLDDEMSLGALMKLRRGAWGGSNGSLRSSAGSPPPHTFSSSHRGSLAGISSEASPSEARPSDELLVRELSR